MASTVALVMLMSSNAMPSGTPAGMRIGPTSAYGTRTVCLSRSVCGDIDYSIDRATQFSANSFQQTLIYTAPLEILFVKMKLAGLEPASCRLVKAPRIASPSPRRPTLALREVRKPGPTLTLRLRLFFFDRKRR